MKVQRTLSIRNQFFYFVQAVSYRIFVYVQLFPRLDMIQVAFDKEMCIRDSTRVLPW